MQFRPFLAILLLLAAGNALAADPPAPPPKKALPPDAPLVTDGSVVVDRADFDGAMLRIPEQYRAEVRMGYDRIATLVDGVYVARELALRAKAAGLDKDPAVQKRLQQVQEAFLADLYREKVEKETATGNLDQRAHELYLADQPKYVAPEEVHIQQILVSLKGRTVEQARERAQKAFDEAKAGKEDFLAYASLYSDEVKPHGSVPLGDSGWGPLQQLVPPVRDAVAKLSKGGISPPVQSEYGFHVVKLLDRKPARQLTFDEVKGQIVGQERERLRKERVEALIRDVRSSPTATVHTENVDALVIPLDPSLMKRAQEAKAK
jgi:parvulin-like peptidyl-prolyl isomerase